jgi:hypothetical protein
MNHPSTLYNNAGVTILEHCFRAKSFSPSRERYLTIAMQLFEGALEAKLDMARCNGDSLNTVHGPISSADVALPSSFQPAAPLAPWRSDDEWSPRYPTHIASSSAQSLAHFHYQQLHDYLQERDQLDDRDEDQVHSDSRPPIAMTSVPMEHRGSFIPYLCEQPFAINDRVLTLPMVSDLVVGSIMVYNLALVHQCQRRDSSRAASLYELSAYLLQDVPFQLRPATWPLRLALLNNFGVWCLENGDGESMLTCMEYLSVALKSNSQSSLDANNNAMAAMTAEALCGMRSNIDCILTPHHGSSPAA